MNDKDRINLLTQEVKTLTKTVDSLRKLLEQEREKVSMLTESAVRFLAK